MPAKMSKLRMTSMYHGNACRRGVATAIESKDIRDALRAARSCGECIGFSDAADELDRASVCGALVGNLLREASAFK